MGITSMISILYSNLVTLVKYVFIKITVQSLFFNFNISVIFRSVYFVTNFITSAVTYYISVISEYHLVISEIK